MAIASMPSVDQNTCGSWTENQITAYQSMPFYLAKMQVETKKWFPTFSKTVKKIRWKPNMGPIMRGVRTNASPHMRQFANPRPITQDPLTDIMDIRESTSEAQVLSHDFESPVFNFYPEFNDFMSHIDDNGKDIIEKIERFRDIFLRGNMFHMSPYCFVCNNAGLVDLVLSPYWSGSGTFDPATMGKTTPFLTANRPSGNLKASCIEMAMTIAEIDLRIKPFRGSELPKEDQPLASQYLIVMDSEAWNQFPYDPLVLQNRSINMDLITNGYRGSFFGRSVARLEDLPLRYAEDGTFYAPEVRVAPGEINAGETIPNKLYAGINNSAYAVAWLIGENGYSEVESGPPPSMFTGDKFPNAPKMDWSGVPRLTKNFLLPCVAPDGTVQQKTNSKGKYIRFECESTFGILPEQRRNAIPILYQRKRGPGNPIK